MRIPTFLFLTASLLGSFGSCGTKFISPPDWRVDERSFRDTEKNRRYVVGETIPLKWETDADDIGLYLVQVGGLISDLFPLANSRKSWEAKYDESGKLENGEDTMYSFAIFYDHVAVAWSHYFNVTAPKKDSTRTVTAPPSTVTISQNRPIETETTSTAISTTPKETKPASNEEEVKPKSGMSQGEVAGAAVGGAVGALLIFGLIGWLLWRRRNKTDLVGKTAVQYQEQVVETKAELPGENKVDPSEYAKSPTGIYEAP